MKCLRVNNYQESAKKTVRVFAGKVQAMKNQEYSYDFILKENEWVGKWK